VLDVLDAIDCDVVCLQEIKCETNAFPYMELEERGWNCEVLGQKSYNGVALLSKHEIEDVTKGLPTIEDDQARYIEALIRKTAGTRRSGRMMRSPCPKRAQNSGS
jgi:exodeoxyribonuclease-3